MQIGDRENKSVVAEPVRDFVRRKCRRGLGVDAQEVTHRVVIFKTSQAPQRCRWPLQGRAIDRSAVTIAVTIAPKIPVAQDVAITITTYVTVATYVTITTYVTVATYVTITTYVTVTYAVISISWRLRDSAGERSGKGKRHDHRKAP
jgi:hypothetical protein